MEARVGVWFSSRAIEECSPWPIETLDKVDFDVWLCYPSGSLWGEYGLEMTLMYYINLCSLGITWRRAHMLPWTPPNDKIALPRHFMETNALVKKNLFIHFISPLLIVTQTAQDYAIWAKLNDVALSLRSWVTQMNRPAKGIWQWVILMEGNGIYNLQTEGFARQMWCYLH